MTDQTTEPTPPDPMSDRIVTIDFRDEVKQRRYERHVEQVTAHTPPGPCRRDALGILNRAALGPKQGCSPITARQVVLLLAIGYEAGSAAGYEDGLRAAAAGAR